MYKEQLTPKSNRIDLSAKDLLLKDKGRGAAAVAIAALITTVVKEGRQYQAGQKVPSFRKNKNIKLGLEGDELAAELVAKVKPGLAEFKDNGATSQETLDVITMIFQLKFRPVPAKVSEPTPQEAEAEKAASGAEATEPAAA